VNSSPRKAFTLVEAMMVTVIAVFVMMSMQGLFSHAVRSSLKGQDNLETMRAASRIFSELRKDLLEFKSLATAVDSVEIPVDKWSIGDDIEFSTILQIERKNEVIVYSLCEENGRKYVERASQEPGSPVKRVSFGVPRMKSFEVVYLKIENNSLAGTEKSGQIVVNLVIQSDDPRFPTQKLSVSSSYFPEKLQETDWNYLVF
jgi:type II secretory pathway pseudopilin PulG